MNDAVFEPLGSGPPVSGRIVHAADLHLGAPLDSLGVRIGADKAARLRDRSIGAFGRLIDATIACGADALVLAGDVYDQADREVAAQLRLRRGLERLADEGIRVFVAHGNHDPVVTAYRPASALPSNVTVFEPGGVQVRDLELRSGEVWHVAGVSFARAAEKENLAARFARLDTVASRTIAVLHANLAGSSGHDPYAPCSLDDLAVAPVAYWALGHVHLRSVASLGPGRWWAYPGNLQGRSTKPAECGPKGALVVPLLVGGGVGEPSFVACDEVRFVRLDVDVARCADIGSVVEAVVTASADAIDGAEGRPIVAKVRLVGACEVHHDLLRAAPTLRDLVREDAAGLFGEGELVSVEVATRPMVERAQLVARGDLVSALLGRLDELREAPPDSVLDSAGEALDTRTRDLFGRLAATDPTLAARLLDAVEQRLVDELAVTE